jgi:hypothetical protein
VDVVLFMVEITRLLGIYIKMDMLLEVYGFVVPIVAT